MEDINTVVYFKPEEAARILLTPRPELRMKGYSMPPPERIYLALTLLFRGDQYYANLLLDTPPAGVLDLIDMQKEDAVLFSPPSGAYRVEYYILQQGYPTLPNQEAVQSFYLAGGENTYKVDTTKLASLPDRYSHIWYVYKTVIDKDTDAANSVIKDFFAENYQVKTRTYFRDFEIVEYVYKLE